MNNNQSQSALSFTAVNKSFFSGKRKVQALHNTSFSVKRGKVTGLIGPDGAGKTTLMRLSAGLLTPDSGEIHILNLNVLTNPLSVQSKIGYMPQRFGLYEDLTVQENLNLYANLQNVNHKDRPARFEQLMKMTGLASFTQRLAGKLSGGMKQKLGLACTLIRSPELLLLDEPTVGVDPVSRRELWQIVYQQVQETGMTVMLSTAYLDEAERCNDVILIHKGEILGQAEPDAFSQQIKGRTFQVNAKDISLSRRQLQATLSKTTGILDALIEGDNIRIVIEDTRDNPQATPEKIRAQLSSIKNLDLIPVKPKFEDAFIARLKTKNTQLNAQHLNFNSQKKSNNDVIIVKNLKRRFGDFLAVNDISFTVKRGEIFGLLGANGAGKSTTFSMLCGLLPVSEGIVSVAGYNLRQASAQARNRIGYMAQKFSLYSDLSVLQNLQFFSSAYGLRNKKQKERVQWALSTFDLTPFQQANAGDLAQGYKQRLSFAVALMHEPEILFLDEPTSGVDPLARREFWVRTNALAEAGVTILVTTHFMDEANYCDHLVIMAEGKVLAQGTPTKMKAMAKNHQNPDPTMEDAFIHLIENKNKIMEAVS